MTRRLLNLDPKLTDEKIEQLLYTGYESDNLDFKETFDDSPNSWKKIAKDVFAMANSGGGYIVMGVKEARGEFVPVGLDLDFNIDPSVWFTKLNNWSTSQIGLVYKEHITEIKGERRKFAVIHVKRVTGNFVTPKVDGVIEYPSGTTKTEFQKGVLYTRSGTSSVPAQGEDFYKLLLNMISRASTKDDVSSLPLAAIEILQKKAETFKIQEPIWSNLFPVTEIPDKIYSIKTDYHSGVEVFDFLKSYYLKQEDGFVQYPGFILKEGKLYTFENLNIKEAVLRPLVKSLIHEEDIRNWISDDKKSDYLIELLNRILKNLCRLRGFNFDKKRNRFYSYYNGINIKEVRWKPAKKTSTRPLVYIHGKGFQTKFYEHVGGKIKFMQLGEIIFLLVDPVRVLTTDGRTPVEHKSSTRFHVKKNTRYFNPNYLYDVKFLVFLLAGSKKEIILNGLKNPVRVAVKPLTAKAAKGISEDRNVDEKFLDELMSEPIFEIGGEDLPDKEENPLTENPLEN